MSEAPPQPWDRLEGEPESAYRRFLFYLAEGPARTLHGAYATFLAESGDSVRRRRQASEGSKRHRAPGQWHADSRQFRWVERTTAWDLALLQRRGEEVERSLRESFRAAGERAARRLLQPGRPTSWKETLRSLLAARKVLGPVIAAMMGGDDGRQARG